MIPETLAHLAIPIDSIQPHPRNVRQGDVGAISESLKLHGQYRPIVVQKSTGHILAGNHTYKAARALKWKQIAATYVDVTDDQAIRILLMDNRANDLASYDDPALADILKQLMETEQRLEGTGFDPDDLEQLLRDIDAEQLPTVMGDPDEVPEDVPAKTAPGDVWLLGRHRLRCGSSLEASDLDALMQGAVVDCILTDPPYGMNLDADYSKMPGGNANSKMNKQPKKYKQVIGDDRAFDASFLRAYFNKAKEQFWFGADYYRSTLSDDDRDGSWLIWDKRKEDGSQDDVLGSTFETCWTANPHQRRILRHYWCGAFGSPEARNRVHPTQKPIALLTEILERWTKEGWIIADPFGGSGSTLIAAEQTNRTAYLMELDPHYCDVICARFQKATGIKPIAEATGNEHDFL